MAPDSGRPKGRAGVLVVDDCAGELEILISSLGPRFDVIRADTDAAALAVMRDQERQLAMVLAGVRSEGLLAEARALRPSCRRVLVTGDAGGGGSDANTLIQVVNAAHVHRVLRRPLEAEAASGVLLELAQSGGPDGADDSVEALRLANQELFAKETFLSRSLDDQSRELLNANAEIERISRDLELLSYRDALTGLYNHRAFQERLREEMARARRYGKPLSLLYCDIDDFASLNAELGYQVGDAILRRLAEVLSATDSAARLRESDVAARYGGEELVILLPETSKEGAAIKAERLRAAVEQASFPGDRAIHISIGIAGFPDDAGSPDDLVRSAEQALREAKAAGRNCVRVSPEEESVAGEADGDAAAARVAPSDAPRADRYTSYHVRLFDIVTGLRRDRSLACLYVDLSQLREVERELGPTTHAELFLRAGDLLDEMRGDRLRRDDMVCRTEDSDGYLCFLSSPREGGSPLDLESIASRVEATLERTLRQVMNALTREQPRVVVGFSRVLDNPLIRPERLVVRLVAEARRSAGLHRERATQRHKAMLQEIILRDMLCAVYQPIVDLTSCTTFGFEGLARGPRDTTLETPTALFSVADKVDLTFELDRACFRSALHGAVGLEPVHRLFVNLLPTSFYDSSFIESEVSNLLEAANLTPANVVFEITERLAIENFSSFRRALGNYTGMGFGVAIDDVGTRHSNLETVMALRPHFVKLSDVLTRGVSKSTVKREMVRSLQRIAEAIDAVIVAEGIETLDDLAVLCELGVRYGQGFFLARPGPPFPRMTDEVKRAVKTVMRGGSRPSEITTLVLARLTHGEIDEEDGEVHEVAPPPAGHRAEQGSGRAEGEDGADFSEPTRPRFKPLRPAASDPPPMTRNPTPLSLPDVPLDELGDLGRELGVVDDALPLIGSLRRTRPSLSDGFEEETTGSGGPAN